MLVPSLSSCLRVIVQVPLRVNWRTDLFLLFALRLSVLCRYTVDIGTKRADSSTNAMRFLRELKDSHPEILQQNERLIVGTWPVPQSHFETDCIICPCFAFRSGENRLLRETRMIYAGDNYIRKKTSRGRGHIHNHAIQNLPSRPSITALARDNVPGHHMIVRSLNLIPSHSPVKNYHAKNLEIEWHDLDPSLPHSPPPKRIFIQERWQLGLITRARHQ